MPRKPGRIGIQAQIKVRASMPLCLTLSDPDGNSVTVSGAVPQAALSKETTEEMIRQSLNQVRRNPVSSQKANISLESGLAVPVSALNQLRREAVEALSAQRSRPKEIPFSAPQREPLPKPDPQKSPALWVRLQYPSQLDRELWRHAQRIILPLDQLASLPVTGLEEKLVAQLPAMLFDEEQLLQSLEICRSKGVRYAMSRKFGRDFTRSKNGDAANRRFWP